MVTERLCILKRHTYGVAPSFLHVKAVRPIVDHLGCVVLYIISIFEMEHFDLCSSVDNL